MSNFFLHTNKKKITLIKKRFLNVIKNIQNDIDAHYDLLLIHRSTDMIKGIHWTVFLNCSITENNPYIYLEMSTVPTHTVPFHTKL